MPIKISIIKQTIKHLKMTIRHYITFMSRNQIIWYMEENMTEEEAEEYNGEYDEQLYLNYLIKQQEYLASSEYELYSNYLIETWVSNVKDELGYNDEILDDPNLDPIFNSSLVTSFDKEWLVDIFERHILDSVCLK